MAGFDQLGGRAGSIPADSGERGFPNEDRLCASGEAHVDSIRDQRPAGVEGCPVVVGTDERFAAEKSDREIPWLTWIIQISSQPVGACLRFRSVSCDALELPDWWIQARKCRRAAS
eukprot:scaffold29_cov251-Pinguiococcus_pyrenoidosus.AAC.12